MLLLLLLLYVNNRAARLERFAPTEIAGRREDNKSLDRMSTLAPAKWVGF